MKDKYSNPPIVGGASLITIFAILCLIVFTLLNLSTVIASQNLAQASRDSVKSYYAADSEAEEIFAQLRNGETPDTVTVNGNNYSYECRISSTQTLYVELSFKDGSWNIINWCSHSTK